MSAGSKARCIAVFGGTGFLGKEIVKHLSARAIGSRLAVRHPDSAVAQALVAQFDRVEAVYADVRDETSVASALGGCDGAVNAVGLYVESGGATFEAVHEIGALNVSHQAAELGLKRLVHISGIGADQYASNAYIRSRGKGELFVRDVFELATVLRPSVLFGPGTGIVEVLSNIIRVSPVIPLFGNGAARLQPVFVADVAQAVCNAIEDGSTCGKTYELGGPQIISYRELIELVMQHADRKRLLVPIPFAIWNILALAASILPNPPITRAQVALVRQDNVVADGALSFRDLEVVPTALASLLGQNGRPPV